MSKITFESDDGTKKIIMEWREDEKWDFKIDCNFSPRIGDQNKEEFYFICFNHLASLLAKESSEIDVSI